MEVIVVLGMAHSQNFLLPLWKLSSSCEGGIYSKHKAALFYSEAGATLDQPTSAAAAHAALNSEVVNFHWCICL